MRRDEYLVNDPFYGPPRGFRTEALALNERIWCMALTEFTNYRCRVVCYFCGLLGYHKNFHPQKLMPTVTYHRLKLLSATFLFFH